MAFLNKTSALVFLILFTQSLAISQNTDSKQNEKAENQPIFPQEIWVRIDSFEIPESSPARQDASFNNPPRVFIICKKNDIPLFETGELSGWKSKFSSNPDYEFLIEDNPNDTYTFEFWDKQRISSKKLFTIGPIKGSEIKKNLFDNQSKTFAPGEKITIYSDDNESSIVVSFNGTRLWYRLVNINFPETSIHRKNTSLNDPPIPYIGMLHDGKLYGSYSTATKGWNVDFPKSAENCWSVREGTKKRYTIEVWDYQRHFLNGGLNFDHQILTITGLKAEAFREPIFEEINSLTPKTRKACVIFERTNNPNR